MKRLIVLISVTFLILGFTGTAGALPMNFGFETGDFSYWNKSISGDWAKVVTSHSDYGPKAGNYFAKLKAVGTEGTQIYQNFSIGADETISGWAAFNWGDYPDYWDSAWVKIYEGTDLSANPLYTAWNESGANPYNNDPDPNDHYPEYYNVPWAQWSWKAPSTVTGTYTIAYGVANTVDGAWPSTAYFDAVTITDSSVPEPTAPVPEPGTMILLSSGLIGVAGMMRRRRKERSEK